MSNATYNFKGKTYAIVTLSGCTDSGTKLYDETGTALINASELKGSVTYAKISVDTSSVTALTTTPGAMTTAEIVANSRSLKYAWLWAEEDETGTWTSTGLNWSNPLDSSADKQAYISGESVEFNAAAGTEKSITVSLDTNETALAVDTLKITGGSWTFTGLANVTTNSIYIAEGATLAVSERGVLLAPSNLCGSGTLSIKGNASTANGHGTTINLANSTGFTGTIIYDGNLGLSGMNLGNATALAVTSSWMWADSGTTNFNIDVLATGSTTNRIDSRSVINFNKKLTVDEGSTLQFYLTSASNASNLTISNLVLKEGATVEEYTSENPTKQLVINNLTIEGSVATICGTQSRFGSAWQIGSLTGTNVTLTFDSRHSANNAAVLEFGGVSGANDSSFTGEIKILQNEQSANAAATGGTGRHVAVVISDESILQNAVVNFSQQNTTSESGGSLVLGVNTEYVKIAGLKSAQDGDDTVRTKVFSGTVTLGATSSTANAVDEVLAKSATANTLEINTATGTSYVYTGDFDNVNLVKTGEGSQTISGTFSGDTVTVSAGTLALGAATIADGITTVEGTTFTATTLSLGENSESTLAAGTFTVSTSTTLGEGASLVANYSATNGTVQGWKLGTITTAAGSSLTLNASNSHWGFSLSGISGELTLNRADGVTSTLEHTLVDASAFTGTKITLGEGVILQNLGNSGNTATFTGTEIAGAGTLRVHGSGSMTLTDSTISAAISVESSATLYLAGTIDINQAIENLGTVSIVDSTIFLLDNLTASVTGEGTDEEVRIYTLVDGGTVTITDTDTTVTSPELTAANFQFEGGLLSSRKTVTVTAGTGLIVTVSGSVADLIWNGGASGTWQNSSADDNKFWTNQNNTDDYFVQNDNVEFATSDAVITVSGDIETKNLKVTENVTLYFDQQADNYDSGTAGTFVVQKETTIADEKALTIQSNLESDGGSTQAITLNATGSTGTISVDHQSSDHNLSVSVGDDFAGTLVWSGNLNPEKLTNITGLSHLTLKNNTATGETSSIWSSDEVAFNVNTTIEGSYGFQVETTFNGSLTGTDATIASGTVNATGAVSGTFGVATDATFNVSGAVAQDSTLTISAGTANFTGTNSGTIAVADGAKVDFGDVLSTAGTFAGTVTGSSGATVSVNISNDGWYNYIDLGTGFAGTVEIHAADSVTAKGIVLYNSDTQKAVLGDGATIKFFDATGFANSSAVTMNYNIVFAGTANTFQSNSSSTNTTDKQLTIGGTMEILQGATASATNGQVVISGKSTIDGTLNVTTTQYLTLDGGIAGSGAINVTAGTSKTSILNLNGDGSSYTGTITVAASGSSTLNINNANAIQNANLVDNGFVYLGVTEAYVNSISGNGHLNLASGVSSATLTAGTSSFTGTIHENVTLVAQALTGTISLGANATIVAKSGTIGTITTTADTAKVELSASVTEGSITLAEGSKIVISNDFVSSTIDPGSPSTISESETASLNIIAASALSVADTSVDWSAATSDTIASYFEYDEDFYGAATFACSNGIITMSYAIPEPSMFGLLAGTLALALAGTRRRRQKKL